MAENLDPNKLYIKREDSEWRELPDYNTFLDRLENLETKVAWLWEKSNE